MKRFLVTFKVVVTDVETENEAVTGAWDILSDGNFEPESVVELPDHFVIGIDNAVIVSPGNDTMPPTTFSNGKFDWGVKTNIITDETQAIALAIRLVKLGYVLENVDIEARDEEGNTIWVQTIWEHGKFLALTKDQ